MLFPVIFHRDSILLSTTYSMWEFLQYDMQPTDEHCLLLDVYFYGIHGWMEGPGLLVWPFYHRS